MSDASDIEEQAAAWIARRDGEHWSDELQQQLQAWLEAAVAHRVAYLRLDSSWRRADRLSSMHAPGRAAVPPRRLARSWRVGAGLLLAGAALFAATGSLRQPASYQTAIGEHRPVELADGTHVQLNTATRLRASVDAHARTVTLDGGEAYFEVAHDAAHPFVIEAGAARVTVLGTRFSVRRDGARVAVMVVEGRVKVESHAAGDAPASVILTGNDTAVAGSDGALRVAHEQPGQLARQLGWRQGKLFLDQMTLGDAAQEFNRYNRVQLVVADAAVAQIHIGGSFNVDNVAGFARLLEQGFGLKVERGADRITVRR
jgi:transmembrane sensor